MNLDEIIQNSARQLISDLAGRNWIAREREIVNLFTFGYLLQHCKTGGILSDPTQIGIEVAVPQHLKSQRSNPDVCKDLVIWPKPKMTCWDANRIPANYPLSVLEWKVMHFKDSKNQKKKLSEFHSDIEWLRNHSKLNITRKIL